MAVTRALRVYDESSRMASWNDVSLMRTKKSMALPASPVSAQTQYEERR